MSIGSSATKRHLQHATGYIGLGMFKEASEEIAAIASEDRQSLAVLEVRADLYMEAKSWDDLIAVASELARKQPKVEKGWIHWAYALRELNRVAEAKAVLLEAEPIHGQDCIVLHHNLACYHCLLGEREQARQRLRRVFARDQAWRAQALADPDLAAMRDEIAKMP